MLNRENQKKLRRMIFDINAEEKVTFRLIEKHKDGKIDDIVVEKKDISRKIVRHLILYHK